MKKIKFITSKKNIGIAIAFFFCISLFAQTNPTAQTLPYSQNFGTTTFTVAPTGCAAWTVNSSPIGTQTNAENSTTNGDAGISTATSSQTTGGCYGYATSSNGRFYIQTSSNTTNGTSQLALAINTTGWNSIKISYDIEMISANPRTAGAVLQYRIGTSGSWTDVTSGVYSHNSSDRSNGNVDSYTNLSLPQAAENNSVVQLRWAIWRGTQTGNSSGIAIDNISVTASTSQSAGYFRSKQNGNWNDVNTWQASTNNSTWVNATTTPKYTANTITIQSADSVSFNATDTIDQLVVNGILTYADVSGSVPHINDGSGVDFTINGKFYDAGPSSVIWNTGSSWAMGSNGYLIRNKGTSSDNWRDHYDGGTVNIPSTAYWIVRKTGSDTPVLSSVNNMYYPNLRIENYTSSTWTTGTSSSFTGSSHRPIIKGNFEIGGNGTGNVSFLNSNTNSNPVLVDGNLTLNSGSTLRTQGTGFEVQGDLTLNGSIDYGTSNAKWVLSGSSNQNISGTAITFKDVQLNKASTSATVTLQNPVTVSGTFTFTTGYLFTSSTNLLIFDNGSSATGAGNNSFINGPAEKIGNTAFAFPTGKSANYQPISISAPSNSAAAYIAEYFYSDPGLGKFSDLTLDWISHCEYWNLNNVGTAYAVNVTLGWNSLSCQIPTFHMRLTEWNGTKWLDLGNGATTSGIVTSQNSVNTFGIFTLASSGGGAGYGWSAFICNDGTVKTTGNNNNYNLGDGTNIDHHTPLPVSTVNGIANIIAVSAGTYFCLALDNAGHVWGWGDNGWGQSGNYSTSSPYQTTPLQIPGLNNIVAISAGDLHSLALDASGNVWAWGSNYGGQCGTGVVTGYYPTPVQVSVLSNIVAISASGSLFSLALDNTGKVWTWGGYLLNGFGNGSTTSATPLTTPTMVTSLSNIKAISASTTGFGSGYDFALAIDNTGAVFASGNNTYGQLGNNTTTASSTFVAGGNGLSGVVSISAGYIHSLALMSNGTVYAWGSNSAGELGDGTLVDKHIPNLISSLSNISQIQAGAYHSIVIDNSGVARDWGSNNWGELGLGNVSTGGCSCYNTPQVVNTGCTLLTCAPPIMNSASTATVCSGVSENIPLTSLVSATYSWVAANNPNTTGESITPQTSNTINNTIINNTTSPQTVTYTVTPTAVNGGCVGTPQVITVTVNPAPTMTSANSATICSGGTVNIPLTSNMSATYTWIATNNPNTTGESTTSQTSNTLNNTITNNTASPEIVTYTVVPTSTTTGSCVGTPQVVTVTVNPTPNAIATPTSLTVCSGTTASISLSSSTSGTTFSWIPSQSGVTGATVGTGSITQTLTATGTTAGTATYTITPVANGCTGSPITATITVKPNPIETATPSSQTICSGDVTSIALSSNLTGTTFSWTVSQTGVAGGSAGTGNSIAQTLVATGTVTGTATYSVTPTANGCSGTPVAVTITVNPGPAITVTPSSESFCSGGTTSISLSSSYTVTAINWTVNQTGVTGATAGSGNSITQTLTATVSPSGSVDYTITQTGANGCTSTKIATVTVLQCCSIPSQPDYTNYTASGGTFTGQFTINGLFKVTGNVTFNNATDVVLGAGAKILIVSGATLTITNSHLYACNDMWDGIFVNGPTALGGSNYGILTINSTSLIEDAISAAYTDNGGRIHISNSTFDHDYESVVVKSYFTYYAPTDITIANSTFQCTGGTLRPPHASDHSFAHIDLSDTKVSACSGNTFNLDVDYGILSKNTNLGVATNTFNFSSTVGIAGIYSYTSFYSFVTGLVNAQSNTFNGGQLGVYSKSNLTVDVSNNTFNNQVDAVAVENCGINNGNFNYLTIGSNTITDATDCAISAYNNAYAYKQINNNTISFATTLTTNGLGIVDQELVPIGCTPVGPVSYCHSASEMFYNTITNPITGIWATNLESSFIRSNTITPAATPSSAQYSYGILAQGTVNSFILENTISDVNTNWWINGIRTGGSAMTVGCNSLGILGYGLFFDGYMAPQTYVPRNIMNSEDIALMVNFGAIGPQGFPSTPQDETYDNQWLGTYSSTSPNTMAYNSNGALSPFEVKSSPSNLNPAFNNAAPIATALIPVTTTSNGNSGQFGVDCNSFSSGYAQRIHVEDSIAKRTIAGLDSFPVFDTATKWISKNNLYHVLLRDTGLLNSDTALVAFKNSCNTSNMGLLEKIRPVVVGAVSGEDEYAKDPTRLNQAKSALGTMTPVNAVESNYKNLYTILLNNNNNGLSFNESEVNTITDLANRCPYSDGAAVYIARTVMQKLNGHFSNYMNDCERAFQDPGTGGRIRSQNVVPAVQGKVKTIKLYPNPAESEITIEYPLGRDQKILCLYNLMGEKIGSYQLDKDNSVMKISLGNYGAGSYIYRVFSDGTVIAKDKLLIFK